MSTNNTERIAAFDASVAEGDPTVAFARLSEDLTVSDGGVRRTSSSAVVEITSSFIIGVAEESSEHRVDSTRIMPAPRVARLVRMSANQVSVSSVDASPARDGADTAAVIDVDVASTQPIGADATNMDVSPSEEGVPIVLSDPLEPSAERVDVDLQDVIVKANAITTTVLASKPNIDYIKDLQFDPASDVALSSFSVNPDLGTDESAADGNASSFSLGALGPAFSKGAPLLATVVMVVLYFLFATDDSDELTNSEYTPPEVPSLDMNAGIPPISTADTARLFEIISETPGESVAKGESNDAPNFQAPAPTAASTEVTPSRNSSGRIVLKPGQLLNPDKGAVVTVGPDPSYTASASNTGAGASRFSNTMASKPKRSKHGNYFAPGGLLKGTPVKKKTGHHSVLGLKVGKKFKARLEVGVSSSFHEEVMATVVETIRDRGRVVLLKGDVLKGRSSNDDKRVFIRFHTVLSRGKAFRLAGYAVDNHLPGLIAKRREASFEDRSRSKAVGSAVRGAAREVGNVLGAASAAGRIARDVVEGTASETEGEITVETKWVLEVPKGRVFEIIITDEETKQ